MGSSSAAFNADDQLPSENYDANGDTVVTGGNTFAYNSWLKLVSMNGGQVGLAYNGLGQLVARTAHGITTQYLVDDLNPTGYPQVVEELVGGAVTRTYTYGYERISELQPVNNTWTASFYLYDGRGTVRMLTNSGGQVTDTYAYDGFGNMLEKTGTTPNVYLYRGESWDADLGLYYLRARWYNPATGRFMSHDPYQGSIWDPASLHRYNYARSNPANYIDPSGRADLAELSLNVANRTASAMVLYLTGHEIGCLYAAEGSMVHLIGEATPGSELLSHQLLAQASQCAAQVTWGGLVGGTLLNLGFGYALDGIGMLLEDGVQGIPRLGGAGGNWPVLNEVPNPNVVKQVGPLGCGPACGQMLLEGRGLQVVQQALGDGLTSPDSLAQALDAVGGQWLGKMVDPSAASLRYLNNTGPWSAMMWETGSPVGHWVVVDGLDSVGNVMIRDPFSGTSYEMTENSFLNAWSGGSVWNVNQP